MVEGCNMATVRFSAASSLELAFLEVRICAERGNELMTAVRGEIASSVPRFKSSGQAWSERRA